LTHSNDIRTDACRKLVNMLRRSLELELDDDDCRLLTETIASLTTIDLVNSTYIRICLST